MKNYRNLDDIEALDEQKEDIASDGESHSTKPPKERNEQQKTLSAEEENAVIEMQNMAKNNNPFNNLPVKIQTFIYELGALNITKLVLHKYMCFERDPYNSAKILPIK